MPAARHSAPRLLPTPALLALAGLTSLGACATRPPAPAASAASAGTAGTATSVSAAPASAPVLVGTYERRIRPGDNPPSPMLLGVWQLRLELNGQYTVTRSGVPVVAGHYAMSGDTLTVTDDDGMMSGQGGTKVGRYVVTSTADGPVFRAIQEWSDNRRFVLQGGPLHRISDTATP